MRSRTSSRSAIATPSLQAGSAVQQPVDHQVDADREGGDGRPGDERGRHAENDAVLVVLHDAAPVGLRRLDAEAEEGERQIGRASCRERVGPAGLVSGGAVYI